MGEYRRERMGVRRSQAGERRTVLGVRWAQAGRLARRRPDAAGLLCLAGILLIFLMATPRLANDHVATDMGRVPERIALGGFYPAERNAGGAYRWAQPTAMLATRVEAPGTYRLTLRMQDGPTGQDPRAVAVTLNDRPLATWQLDAAPRDFVAILTITPEEWARQDRIVVGLNAPPLTIRGDPRTLGPVVSAFRLEQTAPPGPWPTTFLLACAVVLLSGYPLLRLGGLPTGPTVAALGGLALAGGAYAALDRPGTLRLLHRPLGEAAPLWGVALGLGLVAGLLLAERVPRLAAYPAAVRDALFVATIMAVSVAPYVGRLGFYGDDWLFLKYLATAPHQTFGGYWGALWDNVPILRQRPVQMVALIGVYRAFGATPLPYHLANGVVLTLAVVCLFLALRALGLPRLVALGIALVYGLLPQYSADRFWIASWMAVQSQAAWSLALFAGLMAARSRVPRRGVAWGGLAVAALLVSLLAYELVLPLCLLSLALIWWRGRRAGQATARLGGLLASQGVAIALVIAFKSRVTIRASLGGTLDLLPVILRQLVKWDYGPYDVGLNARKAVEIGYGDLGVALPRTAWGLADRYPTGGIVIGALGLGLMLASYLGGAHREASEAADRWPAARTWLALVLGGLLTFGLGYGIFLTNTQIQFSVAGIANRTAIAATLGIAASLVGGIGWLCRALPARWQTRAFSGSVAAICCCGFLVCATLGAFWGEAAQRQRDILAAVERRYPSFPPGAVLLLDGACPYVGPAQVFESAWDLAGALSVEYRDPTVRADIVTPRLTVEPTHIATVIYGAIEKEYPYGDGLLVYDYGRNTTATLGDYAAAQRYFQRVNPDRSGGCPPGIEGLGVRLLPWGNP